MNKRIIAALLFAALAASSMGCADNSTTSEPDANESTAVTTGTTAPKDETPSRENTPDSLPDDLDLKAETVTICGYSGFNLEGLYDELRGTEIGGDILNEAIFKRNIDVSERLNAQLELVVPNGSAGEFSNLIRNTVSAGDDTYDIIAHAQCQFLPLSIEGIFVDLSDAPYLDYTKPWWNSEYMDTIAINTSKRYGLRGDISISAMNYLSATYVNTDMFTKNFGDVKEFYNLVLEGKWTLDKMGEYSEAVYQDVNNDSKTDENDIIGFGCNNSGIMDHLSYPAGIRFSERDGEGHPVLIEDQSRNVEVIEALYELLYETPGAFVVNSGDSPKTTAAFINGNSLFFPGLLGSAGSFREMKDDYTIIPTPKLNEEQEKYLSLVHDSASIYGIPVTNQNIDNACAVLEALCAETYRSVSLTYYEVALKLKYTRDDISAQFIDMIRDGATTDFIYANNYAFNGNNLGTIARTMMQNKSADYMSTYAGLKPWVEKALEALINEAKSSEN